MINVEFFGTSPTTGFSIKGHSGFAEEGSDIVCAAVSSAAYMTANTITEICKENPSELFEEDGLMVLKLDESSAHKCADIMQGFVLHLSSLSKEYKQYITVTISEV
ncbi:MAG: ribosomal-processing cysteine protease Prp [Ruminococcus sp.]|nr:ribosomal-processing cysteine protease Prp [Ruminococcus sp.]